MRSFLTGVTFFIALFIGTIPPLTLAAPPTEPINIEADSMDYDWERGEYIAEGNVVITSQEDQLTARKAIFNRQLNQVELFGDVRLKFKQDLMDATYAKIFLSQKTALIEDARIFVKQNNLYLKGDIIEKTGDATYRIDNCTITTCDQTPAPWSIYGSKVEITIDGYGKVLNAALKAKDIPLLYSPIVIFPAKTKRQSGLLIPRFGYSSRVGADFELPFFWNISPSSDATFYQRYMTSKGYMQGIEYRYSLSSLSKGTFILDIMEEEHEKTMAGEELDLSPYQRTNLTRYWLRGMMNQELPSGIQARADLDLVSDQDFLRELLPRTSTVRYRPDLSDAFKRPSEERYSMFRESAVSITKGIEDRGFLEFRSRYFQRPEDEGIIDPQPLGGLFGAREWRLPYYPFYLTLEGEQAYIYRKSGDKGNLLHLIPALKGGLPILGHFTFSPLIRYNMDLWDIKEEGGISRTETKKGFLMGADLSTNLSRTYATNLWDLGLLRHNMIPRIGVEYYHYKLGDRKSPWFNPMDLMDLGKQLTFRWENILTGKKTGQVPTFKDIGNLTLRQGLLLDKGDPGLGKRGDLTPLVASLLFSPIASSELKADLTWDHTNDRVMSSALSLALPFQLFATKGDNLSLGYQSEGEGIRTFNMGILLNMPYNLAMGSTLSRDLKSNENVSSSHWLGYKHQCYGIKMVLDTSGSRTEWGLFIELMGIGEFGGKM